MTTGAGNRDGHEAASQSVDPVVQGLAPGLGHTVGIAAIGRIVGSQGEESGGHGVFRAAHQITADLELDEAVVGQVAVEGGDDPIPVAPSLGQFPVPPIQKTAEPVAVPGHVQPMTSPTFAVTDGAEKFSDFLLDGSLRISPGRFHEFGHRVGSRRQPGQIQMHPPDQGRRIRPRSRLQPGRLQFRQDEQVDGIPNPGLIRYLRRHRLSDRFPGPVIGANLRPIRFSFGSRPRDGLLLLGPRRPQPDPFHQVGDFPLLELAPRRHLNRVPPHRPDQQTLVGPVGHDGGSPVAAFHQTGPLIESQIPLRVFDCGPMASEAVFRQERPHPALEKLQLGRLFRLGGQAHTRADPARPQDGPREQELDPGVSQPQQGHVSRRRLRPGSAKTRSADRTASPAAESSPESSCRSSREKRRRAFPIRRG